LTFSFEVRYGGRGARRSERLVIRIAPAGVAPRGNVDLLRQAELLRTMERWGIPVPRVRWYEPDTRWFGAQSMVVSWLEGRPFQDWAPDPTFDLRPQGVSAIYNQAVDVLARIHEIPWDGSGERRDGAMAPVHEVRRWDHVVAKLSERRWLPALESVRRRLCDAAPPEADVGLTHGDFRGGNLLFERGLLQAVLDWELSGLGAQCLDLAWLLLFADAATWYGTGPSGIADLAPLLVERYRARTGRRLPRFAWYEAVARYRYSVIIGFNLMLHRTGKRDDPLWERMAPCVDRLLDGAAERLSAAPHG
jgi:aminoglycoside phosphotransferase (APT) family kinase protein